MKVFFTLCLVISGVSVGNAQRTVAQDILAPSRSTVSEATQVKGHAFKVLPSGLYDTDDNPLGLRGGGAYYSFTTGSHSYNKTPEIGLGLDSIAVGFAGFNYGFITDLGEISIADVSTDVPEILYLAQYIPPYKAAEIRSEQQRSNGLKINGVSYQRRLPYKIGNSYALRAITYNEADILVALTIVGKNVDGSVEIVWRKLKTFDKPIAWYFTDEEISKKLAEILMNPKYYGMDASVKDNIITLTGKAAYRANYDLRVEIHPLRPIQIKNEVVVLGTIRN